MRNGLGPGDASQAPPPESASPGPLAPKSLPPKAEERSRAARKRAESQPARCQASLPARGCRLTRRDLCRYFRCGGLRGSTWRVRASSKRGDHPMHPKRSQGLGVKLYGRREPRIGRDLERVAPIASIRLFALIAAIV